MEPKAPTPSRTPLWLGLGALVAVAVLAVALMGGREDGDAGETGEAPTDDAAPDGPSGEPAPDGTPATPSPVHPCDAAGLARVDGLEVGATLATDWAIDAIHCTEDGTCTLVDVSHEDARQTLRACNHVEGGPLPPRTHEGHDIFYDSPHTPGDEAVPDATVQALLDAMIARMDAPESD